MPPVTTTLYLFLLKATRGTFTVSQEFDKLTLITSVNTLKHGFEFAGHSTVAVKLSVEY